MNELPIKELTLRSFDLEFTDEHNYDGTPICSIYDWLWTTLGSKRSKVDKICTDNMCEQTAEYWSTRIFKEEEHIEDVFPVWKLRNNDVIRNKYVSKIYSSEYPLNILVDRLKGQIHSHPTGLWDLSWTKIGYDEYKMKVSFFSQDAYERFTTVYRTFIEKRQMDVDIQGSTA